MYLESEVGNVDHCKLPIEHIINELAIVIVSLHAKEWPRQSPHRRPPVKHIVDSVLRDDDIAREDVQVDKRGQL